VEVLLIATASSGHCSRAKLGREEQLKANDHQWQERLPRKVHRLSEICSHAEPHRSTGLNDDGSVKKKA
jgi:hypothetical protein